MVVEGRCRYLWDENGKRYLDGLGGIVTVSVGHCHPACAGGGALHTEMRRLQHFTTIYLQPRIAEYAEKLASKMPGNLKACYFVNSASEANDLALVDGTGLHGQLRHHRTAQCAPWRQLRRNVADGAQHVEIQCAA